MLSRRLVWILLFLTGLTFCQSGPAIAQKSWPVDTSGVPAPPCTVYDPIANTMVFCSTATPLATSTTATGPGNIDLGSGAAFFGGQSGIQAFSPTAPVPSLTLFTPDGLVGFKGSAAGLVYYSSGDGGSTWIRGGVLFAAVVNNPYQAIRTTSATPRYLIGATGGAGGPIYSAVSISGTWTASTGLPNNTQGLSVQGSTVVAVGSNAGATLTQACKSTDNGQTFGACVTVDAAVGSIPDATSLPFTASPSPGIHLASLKNGKIWRTTDSGTTWTTVFTGSAGGSIVCLTSTRCVAVQATQVLTSTDAGATWVIGPLLNSVNAAVSLCPYTALKVSAVMVAPWPTTNGGVTQGAQTSSDGGVTWTPVPTTSGAWGVSNPAAISGPCTVSGTRASFVIASTGTLYTWFGGTNGVGSVVSQTATRADACSLGVTATGAAGAAVTATLPAVLGASHYICLIEIRQYATAALVGGAVPVVVTSTNLAGANAWTFQTALAIGLSEGQSYTPATPIKATGQGVATTIVAPATATVIWRINIYYYTAP